MGGPKSWAASPAEKLKLEHDDDVLDEGSLQILGSERHDSRRIDRQLAAGRAAR